MLSIDSVRPTIWQSSHAITRVCALSFIWIHGHSSVIPPSQYISPHGEIHGVNMNGMADDARIASRIRRLGVVSCEKTSRRRLLKFVADIPRNISGLSLRKSAKVHLEDPGSHVSTIPPTYAFNASPSESPHVVVKFVTTSSSILRKYREST